jgi:hypothetical protein
MKMSVLWIAAPYSLLEVYQNFIASCQFIKKAMSLCMYFHPPVTSSRYGLSIPFRLSSQKLSTYVLSAVTKERQSSKLM